MVKLSAPFKGAKPAFVSQWWKEGAHPAFDMFQPSKTYGYGTPLTAPEDVLILQIPRGKVTKSNTGLANGYGIFMKGLETGQTHLFWHILPIVPVNLGDTIKRGQIVAYMGNAGMVFSGGTLVPVEERLSTKKGTHLHWEVYTPQYKLGGAKLFVNFTDQVDWSLQPTYTVADQLKATVIALAKISKLIS